MCYLKVVKMYVDLRDGDLNLVFEEEDFQDGEDIENLGDSFLLEGELRNFQSGLENGSVLFRYDEGMKCSKPGVAVYDSDDRDSVHGSEYDIEVVIGDRILEHLSDGEVYGKGVDEFQEIPDDSVVKFFLDEGMYDPEEYQNSGGLGPV